MKPRPSLDLFFSSDPKDPKKTFHKSKSELNTPNLSKATSPTIVMSSVNSPNDSRKFIRRKTFCMASSTKGMLSPIPERKCSSPNLKNQFFPEEPVTTFSQAESPNKQSLETSQVIIAARESLYQLRQEARSYYNSSRRALQDAQKSRRSSVASEDFRNYISFCYSEANDPIKELAENINSIKNRILLNELNSEQQIRDDIDLRVTLEKIEEKLDSTQYKIEKKTCCEGCASRCNVF